MYEIDGSFYDWDENKHEANIKKHGINFYEAASVFLDPHVVEQYDFEHSIDEDRFIAIGISEKLNMLIVCHCYRGDDDIIRIISARYASKRENEIYGGASWKI